MPDEGRYEKPMKFFRNGGLALWRFIFKKELLDKSGLIFPKDVHIKRGYDTSFIVQYLMYANSIYFLSEKLYNYWQREDSLVHSFNTGKSQNKFDVWYGFEYLLNFMEKNHFYEIHKYNIFSWINSRFYYLFSKLSDEGKIKALEIIHNIFIPYKKDIEKRNHWLYFVVHKRYHSILKELFNVREIKFIGISIYKRIRDGKNKKVYIFGIPVFRKNKENGYKEIYLGQWCVYRRKNNVR